MGSRQPSAFSRQGWRLDALLALAIFGAVWLGPRIMDGLGAFQWTRYYATRGIAGRRAAEQAERAGRFAARAVEDLAPLPLAVDAARLALDLGRGLEPRDPAAAVALCSGLRPALEGVRASRLRGIGLGSLADEARSLEESARGRSRAGSRP